MLRVSNNDLDAMLITHSHYDHVGGIDDLRPYCSPVKPFPIFCQECVATDLRNRIPYCFATKRYPGVPSFDINIVKEGVPFNFEGITIEPIHIMHLALPILGYRIGNLAYITDAKSVDDSVINSLKGIDYLVINSLRKSEHISHLSLSETLAIIERISPTNAYLTHLSHDMGLHSVVENELPENVHLAYDNLILRI